jgi:hypothetical protein
MNPGYCPPIDSRHLAIIAQLLLSEPTDTMSQSAATLIGAIIAAAAVVLTAYVTFMIASRRLKEALEEAYDKELRSHCIESYLKLWALLDPFARYPRPERLNYSCLQDTSVKLRRWYFSQGGGLFLSEATREAYFNLQDALKAILDKHENASFLALAELRQEGRPLAIMLARSGKLKEPENNDIAKYLHEQLSRKTATNLSRYWLTCRWFRRTRCRLASLIGRVSELLSLPDDVLDSSKIVSFLCPAPNRAIRRDLIDVLNTQLGEVAFYRKLITALRQGQNTVDDEFVKQTLVGQNRKLLQQICEREIKPKGPQDSEDTLDPKRSADLIATASNLRTMLTEDVLTRRKPVIG